MGKIKVGVIGCGGMGRLHSKILSQMEDVEIFAASDLSEKALKLYNETFKPTHSFTDYTKLVELDELNAVLVCLPTYLHKDPVVLAAKNNKAIFCEKPISMTLEDADEMVNECDKRGVIFSIGFVRRFDNGWGKFKEIILSGKIGRPVVWRNFMITSAPSSLWYMDKEKGGGPFIDGCVHNYDFARYVFGDINRVAGLPIKIKASSTALDTGTFVLEFKSGDQHILNWSWGLPAKCGGKRFNDVFGPNGTIYFQDGIEEKDLPEDFDPQTEGVYLFKNGEETQSIRYKKNQMFNDQMKHFINCVKGIEKPKVTGLDGYEAQKIGLSVLKIV